MQEAEGSLRPLPTTERSKGYALVLLPSSPLALDRLKENRAL